MKTTKIRIGFKSKNQLPLIMIWKEYYIDDKLDFAKVIFEIWINKRKYISRLNIR